MKLRCNLSTLMGSRRYSIQDVHKMTGLSRGTISSLYNDRASRIDYETITKLWDLMEDYYLDTKDNSKVKDFLSNMSVFTRWYSYETGINDRFGDY